MSKLVLFLADGGMLDIKLDRERLSIGRRPDNDVCLPYPAVSGEHAAVVTILDDSFLEDQGSTNGTLVNGRPITKHFLRDRDQVDIGRQRLVYVVDEAATVEVPRSVQMNTESRVLGERVGGVRKPMPIVHGNAVPQAGDVMPASPVLPPLRGAGSTPSAVAAPAEPADVGAGRDTGDEAAPVPTLKVLTGASAGRALALTRDEMLVGRVGLQVAALRRTPEGLRLVPLEGRQPPTVNGVEVGPTGLPVEIGDVIEVAGARLELTLSGSRAAGSG